MSSFNVQYVLSGDHESAKQAFRTALEQEGFTVKEERHDQWRATHGSIAKTAFLGVFAGDKSQREVFTVSFGEEGGALVVQLHRTLFQFSAGAQDGLELIRLTEAYEHSEAALRDRLAAAGLLVSASL